MPSNDPELSRRWKKFVVSHDILGKIVKGELSAERTLQGAKFLGAMFYHDSGIIAMFYERHDFPETRLGDAIPEEILVAEPVIRIFH